MDYYDYTKEEMVDLLVYVSRLWKRKISAYDSRVIEDMFLEYSFAPDMIRWLLRFIYDRGAEKLDYLYPIANLLKKQNIFQETEAEILLNHQYTKYKNILKILGSYRTVPTKAEKQMIDSWYQSFTDEQIRNACERTYRFAKTPSLAYVNAILNRDSRVTGLSGSKTVSKKKENS